MRMTPQTFLDKLLLPKVPPLQLETLNTPIVTSEISMAIQHLAPNKGPGSDAFAGKFYKTLQDLVKPTLLQLYNGKYGLGVPTYPLGTKPLLNFCQKKRKTL